MVDYEGIFGHIESVEVEEEISTGSISESGELNEVTLATLEKYKRVQDKKEKVNIKFTAISNKNNAFAMEDGVKIVLRYPLMSNELKQRVANGPVDALKMLVKGVDVMITGSSLHGTVPVVYASCTKIKDMKKEAGKAALADMLSRHDLTPLRAVVIRVDKGSRTVLLDIGGLGIKGVCRMIDWSDSPMTEVMMDTIKPGLEVMVKVTGRTSRIVKKDGQLDKVNTGAYKCVRRSYSDPYEGLSANFPVGTSVIAKLVKMEGNMCFMQIDGFDRLHILCFKPWLRDEGHENTSGVNKVIVGHVYTVEVTVCDEKMRKFRGRIVREHPTRTDKDLEGFMKYKEKVTEGAITASASSKED